MIAPPDPTALLDLVPGLVAFLDRDLRYRYASAGYRRWSGLDPAALIGESFRRVVGENAAAIEPMLRRALAGEPVSTEFTLFRGAQARPVHATYVPHRDPDGTVTGVLVTVLDRSDRPDLQARVAQAETMFENAFRAATIGMALTGDDGRFARVNPAFARMLGYEPDELAGAEFRAVTHPDDLAIGADLLADVLAGRSDGYQLAKRYCRKDGTVVHARLAVSVWRDAAGRATFVTQIEDVTEALAAERRLTEANAQLSLALDALRGGFWHMDVPAHRFQTSAPLSRFIAGPDAEAFDLDGFVAMIEGDDLPSADLGPLLRGEVDRSAAEYRLHTVEGTRWMRCSRRLLRDGAGAPERIVGVVIDITEDRAARANAEEQADTDALTGLLNRRGLTRRLDAGGMDAAAVLAIDLDGFKGVNDRLGHATGDRVLVEMAVRLRGAVRRGDLLARLGGDEFVLVAADTGSPLPLEDIAQRLTATLNAPLLVDGVEAGIGAGVGVARCVAPCLLSDVLLLADAALYRAKRAGRGTWRMAA